MRLSFLGLLLLIAAAFSGIAAAQDFVMVVEAPSSSQLDANQLRKRVSKAVDGTARALGDDAAIHLKKVLTVVVARGGRKAVLILTNNGRVIAMRKIERNNTRWLLDESVRLMKKSPNMVQSAGGSGEVIDPWYTGSSDRYRPRRIKRIQPTRDPHKQITRVPQSEVIDPWVSTHLQSRRTRIRKSRRERARLLDAPQPKRR